MKAFKTMAVACCIFSLLLAFGVTPAQAECCYFNPLALPFLAAGAVVGTAAALVTGFVPPYPHPYPAYYGPPAGYYGPRYYRGPAWAPGHYDRYGRWIPGHRVWY